MNVSLVFVFSGNFLFDTGLFMGAIFIYLSVAIKIETSLYPFPKLFTLGTIYLTRKSRR